MKKALSSVVKIAYNNVGKPGFFSIHGFAAVVERNSSKVLFDTGLETEGLVKNLQGLNILPEQIDTIFISHLHGGHTGGLELFKSANKNKANIIMPDDFAKPTEIRDGIMSTGRMDTQNHSLIHEQSLFFLTPKGVIIIVGCGHNGIEKVIERAKMAGNIHAIIGGFHDFQNFEALKDIEFIGACHCTQKSAEIEKKFPEQFKKILTGDVFEF